MQTSTAIRSLRLLPTSRLHLLPTARACTCIAAGAGDPAVHSEVYQGDYLAEQQKASLQEHTVPPPTTDKPTPLAPSARLESSEVPPPPKPSFQQKRRWCHSPARPLDDATCVGWDGSPLRGDGDVGDWGLQPQEADEYKEYFKERKPSPLSEFEFVDTRRPISRAWDGGAAREDAVGVIVEDTVDDALQRAEEMFRAAKERGDPDTPWARVLH